MADQSQTIASKLKVFIVGCGLGGLGTALALARHDISSVVVEAAPALADVGAGIQAGPNFTRVLKRLGLFEKFREKAVTLETVSIRRESKYHRNRNIELSSHSLNYGRPLGQCRAHQQRFHHACQGLRRDELGYYSSVLSLVPNVSC
jgi:2-polyprenyl-6-methoxyphenol hydroxylase-like FAD-dependent oxidoreductase